MPFLQSLFSPLLSNREFCLRNLIIVCFRHIYSIFFSCQQSSYFVWVSPSLCFLVVCGTICCTWPPLGTQWVLVALKWWLGHDLSRGSLCPLCPDTALDPLGHHALTCRRGGDVVMRHNQLRDAFVDFCHSACLGVKVEVGSRLTPTVYLRQSHPADVLVVDWERGRPAALDVTVSAKTWLWWQEELMSILGTWYQSQYTSYN